MQDNARRKRIFSLIAVLAAYVAAVFVLYPLWQESVIALSLLPVIVVAVLYGQWPGLLAGLLFFPFNSLLLNLVAKPGINVLIRTTWAVIDSFMLVVAGTVVGAIRDLNQELKITIAERDAAQDGRLEAEQKYHDFIENAADPIVILDKMGKVSQVNRRAVEITGYDKGELEGKNLAILNIMTARSKAAILKNFLARMVGREVAPYEVEFIKKSGEILPIEINAAPIRKRGRIVGDFVILRDITERKRSEARIARLLEETQKANEKLKEMDKVKDEFLSIVTHDLKTPLTSALGYVTLLLTDREGNLSQKQKRYLETVERQCDRLQEMINSILDFTRAEFGKIKVNAEAYSLNTQVMELVEAVKPEADQKKLDLELSLPDEDVEVKADRGMIGRVIANFLSNAVKYTPEGGKVSVDLKRQGDGVRFAVEDNGIGILAEHVPKLFDKFFVVDQARAREKRSLGLGLHISKEFVEAHGGHIGADSRGKGKGARFYFTLATT